MDNNLVLVELLFDDECCCELRASVNDDNVVYAQIYTLDDLARLAEDIRSVPDNPTQADFETLAGDEREELGYNDGGIFRADEAMDVRVGAREIWKLTDFLAHVPDHESAVLVSLLWRVAALDLAAEDDEELAADEGEGRRLVLPFAGPNQHIPVVH